MILHRDHPTDGPGEIGGVAHERIIDRAANLGKNSVQYDLAASHHVVGALAASRQRESGAGLTLNSPTPLGLPTLGRVSTLTPLHRHSARGVCGLHRQHGGPSADTVVTLDVVAILRDMSHLVISPHLDDAVLSCYALLAKPKRLNMISEGAAGATDGRTTVINVFCGLPPDDVVGTWDECCRVSSSWAQVHRRIAEDYEIMLRLGVDARYLGALDRQYRAQQPDPDPLAIAQDISDVTQVDASTTIWMPWAYRPNGDEVHRDHVLTRAAAELFAHDAGIRRLRYYADLPYLHAEHVLDSSESSPTMTVVAVNPTLAKLRACRAYKTQWRYLHTGWRQLRRERYITIDGAPERPVSRVSEAHSPDCRTVAET